MDSARAGLATGLDPAGAVVGDLGKRSAALVDAIERAMKAALWLGHELLDFSAAQFHGMAQAMKKQMYHLAEIDKSAFCT